MPTPSTSTHPKPHEYLSQIATNKILDYDFSSRDLVKTDLGFFNIGNEVILISLISLLYLMSALEEADWNVLSANQAPSEYFVDDTVWNISNIIDSISTKLKNH